jgi:uncharacterized protein YutE (UPF0331/DUF86 family)
LISPSRKRVFSKGDTELVDKILIGRKLALMDTYLRQIREFSKLSVSEYEKNWKTQRIVERTLQILIEECIDIANHIIADKGLRLPVGYADAVQVLMENKVINKKLAATMEKMAKFRNVVIHQYEKIDPKIVVAILHKNLGDFERYKKAIIRFLVSI